MEWRSLQVAVASGVMLLLAGCASIERRIESHPDLFAALAPDVQARVQQGVVEPGDPKGAVFLALGRPDRTYERRTPEGTVTVWSYLANDTVHTTVPVARPRVVRDASGRVYRDTTYEDVWVQERYPYEARRVEFKNDRVIAIEAEQR